MSQSHWWPHRKNKLTGERSLDKEKVGVGVRIRMKRLGRKHRPFFRICVMPQHKHREAPAD